MRRGRFEDPVGIKDLESCPSDCYQRSNCSQCIGEPGRCVWCQERQECFQFSVYIAEYQYGQCKAWIDKDIAENEVSNSDYDQQCQNDHNNNDGENNDTEMKMFDFGRNGKIFECNLKRDDTEVQNYQNENQDYDHEFDNSVYIKEEPNDLS